MATFLSLSGVVGADPTAVDRSISAYVSGRGGTFQPKKGKADELAVIAFRGTKTTVLYPPSFPHGDELSKHLSEDLQAPVFAFHIHAGDLWMFVLFDKGEEAAWFNPMPDYWGKLDAARRGKWKGDPAAVAARVPGLTPEAIRQYFREWNDDLWGLSGRMMAYPDDRYCYGDDLQLTDFMRRLGFVYPLADDGSPIGTTYELKV